jgi:CheY-like chemotaxis protein
LSVKDYGIGIPPENLQSIFELFSQLDRSLERRTGGLGIGLYLVKRLVEMHGGTVTAVSQGKGGGSAFIARLPIVVERPSVVESAVPPQVGAAVPLPDARSRILVVDDNHDAARTLAILLSAHGYVTQAAHDGLQAVDAAEEFNPHVILLDIGLPTLNGYEACQRIRSQSWGKSMILVALTGWGQEEDKRRAEESGFDTHLVKPVDPPKLIQVVAALLKERNQSHAPVTLNARSG